MAGIVVTMIGCSSPGPPSACADVVRVEVTPTGDGTAVIAATVRSDDSGWDGYADRWEVVAKGEVVGTRVLAHPHVDEQPFTRSASGIPLVGGAATVRAHHSVGGYCGAEREIVLDR